MKLSFELEIKGTAERVWEYYANLENWYIWEDDLEEITLDGEFQTGNTGMMKLKNMPPMDYTLTSVIENKEFVDEAITPLGIVSFGHFIENVEGKLAIRHEVSLKSDDKKNVEFLQNIFRDVPKSMFLLKKAAEKSEI